MASETLSRVLDRVSPKKPPDSASGTPDRWWWVGAWGLVTLGWGIGVGLYYALHPGAFQPVPGIDAFAVLYVFAQAIERVLEPFSSIDAVGATKVTATDEPGWVWKTKKNVLRELAKLKGQAGASRSRTAAATPAGQSELLCLLALIKRNRTVIVWGAASFLGMLASGAFGVLLLKLIGLHVPPAVDVPVTGLAIGSGTKPLHDLISNLQKSSAEKERAAAA